MRGGLELADKWILSRFNSTINKVTTEIEKYEFGEAARALYDFIWSEFCDWYVEIAKVRLYGSDAGAKETVQGVLLTVLEGTLKILHPFMPFITEEIYQRIIGTKGLRTIMLETWPMADEKTFDQEAEGEMGTLMEVVRAVRNIRAEFNVPHGNEVEVTIVGRQRINETYLKALAKVGKLIMAEKLENKPDRSASALAGGLEIYVALAGLIDVEKETGRLNKEIDKLTAELGKIRGRLGDQNFLSRAKPESVEKEKEREKEFSEKIRNYQAQLKNLTA